MSNYTAVAMKKSLYNDLSLEAASKGLSTAKYVERLVNKARGFLPRKKEKTIGEVMEEIDKKLGIDKLKIKNKPVYTGVTDDDIYEALKDDI